MQKLSLIDRWAEDKDGFSFLENDETEESRIERLNELSLKVNGGPGSGNPNPGQGRGIGKPSNKSSKNLEYSFDIEPHRRDGIMTNDVMDYLLKNKDLGIKIDDNKLKEYYEKKYRHKDRDSFEEYKDKLIHLQIQKEGGNISDAADFQRYELQDMIKNKILYSDSGTFEALIRYVDGASPSGYGKRGKHPRKNFDDKYGISNFIDKNPYLNYSDKPIYRGLTVTKEFLDTLKKGDKVDMRGVSSWTANEKEAQLFLNGSLVQKGSEKVIFENIEKNKKNTMIYPFSNQAEVLSSDTNKCKVVNIEERTLPIKGGTDEKAIYITVEFD